MRKLTLLTIHDKVGLCPPSRWETVFLWVEYRDGRPVYSDAQRQLEMHRSHPLPRSGWQVVRDPEHILWAEETP